VGTRAIPFTAASGLGRVERRDRNLQLLAAHRLPSSDLIFRQHRDEALVRQLLPRAGRRAGLGRVDRGAFDGAGRLTALIRDELAAIEALPAALLRQAFGGRQ